MQKNKSRRVPLRGQRGRSIPPDFPFKAVIATLMQGQVAYWGQPASAAHIKRLLDGGQAGLQLFADNHSEYQGFAKTRCGIGSLAKAFSLVCRLNKMLHF